MRKIRSGTEIGDLNVAGITRGLMEALNLIVNLDAEIYWIIGLTLLVTLSSTLLSTLIGVPLGVQPRRSARSYGFVLSIFILLAYYVSLIAFEMLAVKKAIPPFMAGWLPTFMFGSLGIYLLIKAASESPFKPAIWVGEVLDLLQKKMNKGF